MNMKENKKSKCDTIFFFFSYFCNGMYNRVAGRLIPFGLNHRPIVRFLYYKRCGSRLDRRSVRYGRLQ